MKKTEENKRKFDRLNVGVKFRKKRIELGFPNAEMFSSQHGINRSVYQRLEAGKDMLLSTFLMACECLQLNPIDVLKNE